MAAQPPGGEKRGAGPRLDGRTLASADPTEIRLWPGDTDALLEQVRHAIRLFTPGFAACRRYFGSETCALAR